MYAFHARLDDSKNVRYQLISIENLPHRFLFSFRISNLYINWVCLFTFEWLRLTQSNISLSEKPNTPRTMSNQHTRIYKCIQDFLTNFYFFTHRWIVLVRIFRSAPSAVQTYKFWCYCGWWHWATSTHTHTTLMKISNFIKKNCLQCDIVLA